jgi:hypothetical protein
MLTAKMSANIAILETFMVPPYGLAYGETCLAVQDRYRISVQQWSKVREVEESGAPGLCSKSSVMLPFRQEYENALAA